MEFKKSIIIIILAIFFVSIASVSAEDVNDMEIASGDTQLTDEIIQASEIQGSYNDEVALSEDDSGKIAISNDNKTLGKTVNELTFEAIGEAIENDCTIYLKPGTYFGDSQISIDGKSNIKIIGNSTILDAQGKTGIFYIHDSRNIIIQNITFKNANSDSKGGAIYFYSASNNHVNDCIFINNSAKSGGAIEAYDVSTYCGIYNCIFINNQARYGGGAIRWFNSNDGRVNNCTFINNHANERSGAIHWSSSHNGRVNDCIFINNTAIEWGAIYANECDLNADYNWFGNNATNYNDSLPISDLVHCNYRLFLNATANPDTITGKDTSNVTFKLYQYHSDVTSDYDNAPFKNLDLTITATKGNTSGTAKLGEPIQFTPTGKGTASVTATVENVRQTVEINVKGDFDLLQDLVNNESLSVINLERNYTYNEFDTITDGVRITRPITINGNGFTIDAKGKSRIFYVTAGSINITNVTLKNGKASAGGAIYFSNAISNSNINATFINNTANGQDIFDGGGANYFRGIVSGLNIGGTYTGNTANGQGSYNGGGANYFRGSVSGSKVTGTYTGNNATRNGGANYFDDSVSGSNVSGTYINNTAEQNGGANYFKGSVSDSNVTGTYTNNKAEGNGGANCFWGSSVLGLNVSGTYINNTAEQGSGGANYFYSVSGSNVSGTYTNNKAEGNGGANCFWGSSVLGLNVSGTYINNTAEQGSGGANYFYSVSGSNVSGTYANNTAEQGSGGANYFGLVSTSNITGTYINNTAERDGGANCFWGSSVLGLNVSGTYINNTAEQGGGGANNFHGTVSGSKVTGIYINNTASNAVIHFEDYSNNGLDANITNAIFLNNNCIYEIYARTQGIVVKDSWFGNNASNFMNKPNINDKVTVDNWLFLNATADPSSLLILDSSKVTFKLYSTDGTNVSDFDNSKLPAVNLTLTATNGEVSNTTLLDKSVEYRATQAGQGSVTASVEDAEYTIFLDNNKRDVGLSVAVDSQGVYYSNNTAIVLIYNSMATGMVNITLKGKKFNYTFEDMALNATVSLGKVNPDKYNITVTYSGDAAFFNATAAGNLTVIPIVDLSVNKIADKSGYYYHDIVVWTITVKNACNGTNATNVYVTDFFPTDKLEFVNCTIPDGTSYNSKTHTWTIGDIANGTELVLAIYSRAMVTDDITNAAHVDVKETDWNPDNNDDDYTVNVLPLIDVSVKITSDNDVYLIDDIATWTITVHNAANGTNATNVNLTEVFPYDSFEIIRYTTQNGTYYEDNGLWDIGFMGNGTDATLTIVSRAKVAGENVINMVTVSCNEADWNKLNNIANKTVNVKMPSSSVNVSDITLDYGVSAEVNVTTQGAKGIIAKIDGNDTVVDNYTIIIPILDAGIHNLTVTTIPDEKHAETTKTATITVNKVNSTLTVNNTVFDYGGEGSVYVSFDGASGVNASVIDQPEAVVYVKDGEITVSNLSAGNYTLTVTTIADDNHNTVNKTIKVTVNPVSSGLEVNGTDIFFGNDAILNYTAVNATGINMSISDWRGNALKEGVDYNITITDSQIIIRFFDDGTYTVNVTALTDDNHVPTSRNVTVHVNPICDLEVILTPMNLTANYGDTITWNATIISHGPSYPFNVNLYAYAQEGLIFKNAYSDSNYYHLSIPFTLYPNIPLYVFLKTLVNASNVNLTLNVSVRDEYFPDPNPDNNNASATVEIEYVKADLNITAPSQITVGDSASVEVALPEDATGNITVKVDGKEITTVSLINGSANVELSDLNAGNHTVEIIYSGDEKYSPANETKEITVSKQDTTAEVTIPANITVGDDANVNVKLPGDATGNVTLKLDGETVDTVPVTNGTANITIPSLTSGNHTVEIAYSGDDKYNPVSETKEITVSKQDVTPEIAVDDANVNVKLPSDATGNVTVKVDDTAVSTVPVTNGTASVKLPRLSAGNHTVEIDYSGDDKYNPTSTTATVSGDMVSTMLTANNVTATYKVKKYLTITLTDSNGSPIANATVSVKLKSSKNYTTDANGQVKVKVSSLVPKTYTAKITFNGDDKYTGSNITAKVTVKKATSKITAKAKTFKTTTKTKKYTVMLKANGKALKNKWVYLKVNGKTYKAKTNSKGKATFKITQLNKAGKFKATVTFKGNDYYKKATKKATIKVKSVWKTIQKGSKNSAIVKKIQRALKNHGYYLEYNGRYLMVDGIFWDYTEMAVKEFQNDKTLKVTGKVDEKTAKKLGII